MSKLFWVGVSAVRCFNPFATNAYPKQFEHLNYVDIMPGVKVRDIEMKIRSGDDIVISPAAGNSNTQHDRLPTGLELVKAIEVDYPRRICHYKGCTYVGTYNNAIDRIDKDGSVTKSFIRLDGYPCGIIAHQDRLYVLQKGTHSSICVFNLLGQQLLIWNHSDSESRFFLGRALAIINNDELVVADRTNKTFNMYSLTGEILRSVRCDEIGDGTVSLCHAGVDAIIVTHYGAQHELFKFNLATGAVEWRSNAVKHPSAVAMLNKEYALVTEWESGAQVKFSIVNQMTGEVRLNVL